MNVWRVFIGSSIGDFLPMPYNYLAEVAAVIPCHIVGRIKAAGIKATGDDHNRQE